MNYTTRLNKIESNTIKMTPGLHHGWIKTKSTPLIHTHAGRHTYNADHTHANTHDSNAWRNGRETKKKNKIQKRSFQKFEYSRLSRMVCECENGRMRLCILFCWRPLNISRVVIRGAVRVYVIFSHSATRALALWLSLSLHLFVFWLSFLRLSTDVFA